MRENSNLGPIINGCKKGDAGCFSQLVDMYASRCYGYFYRLTGNRDISDDLLSELFVKLVEKIDRFRGGTFEVWLFRVASNIFYDYLRAKQHQRKLIEARKNELESESTEIRDTSDSRGDKLGVYLDKLDEDTREVIMLRFYSQASFREIAEIRSEPIGTTLSKVHRGLKKLRELME